MPTYDYQCNHCGLLFEKSVLFSERESTQKCKSCGEQAEPQMARDVSFSFNPNIGNKPTPPNTGISAYDHKADRAIGKSAEFGWSMQEKRAEQKRQLLRDNPNAEYGNLSRNPDNTYRVMGSEETSAVDNRNKMGEQFRQTVQENNKKSIPLSNKKGRSLG
jgi:putative FmdB family regulatory protein